MSEQVLIDRFYSQNGPCCAGCDWWRWINSRVGLCTKSAPVSGRDRIGMLEMESCSMDIPAGHMFTRREHVCGDFKDEQP